MNPSHPNPIRTTAPSLGAGSAVPAEAVRGPSRFIPATRRPGLLLAFALSFLATDFMGCDTSMTPRTADGTSDETHSTVDIAGRVVDEKGAPLPGIVVSTQKLGISDTTDATGRYRIQADRIPGSAARPIAARLGEVPALDTLIVLRNGRELARLPVERWVVTLADIIVGFRDINGLLTGDATKVGRIDAVIRGPGLRLRRVGLSVDSAKSTYSGRIEFASFGGSGEVTVEFQVFGRDSSHIASSGILPVPAQGTIEAPTLDAGAAKMSVHLLVDGPVYEGDSIRIHARVPEAFAGRIAAWEWGTERGGNGWHSTSGPDFVYYEHLGDTTTQRFVQVRVADDSGRTARDSVLIDVLPRPYRWVKLFWRYRGFVKIPCYTGEPLPLGVAEGGSLDRWIAKWEWKVGKGEWAIGTAADSVIVPTEVDSAFRVAVRVTDDLGHVFADSLEFRVAFSAFNGLWDFEDPKSSPVPDGGENTVSRAFSNPASSTRLEWNTSDPVAGARDLKFSWNLGDEGVPGFSDTYVGFDLFLDHGRPVDLSNFLDVLSMKIHADRLDTSFVVYVGLLSPVNPPGDSSTVDSYHKMLRWFSWHPGDAAGTTEFTPDALEWPGWLPPLEAEHRQMIMRNVVGLRFLLGPVLDPKGEISPGSFSGSIRIDDVQFGTSRGPH